MALHVSSTGINSNPCSPAHNQENEIPIFFPITTKGPENRKLKETETEITFFFFLEFMISTRVA